MTKVLSVETLYAGYDNNLVVYDVSFDIEQGEIFGLVGLNGAGKTTLIKTILGLRQAKSGEIVVNDRNDISYLPEKFEPPYFLSGHKFIDFSLRLYGKKMSFGEIVKQAEALSFDPKFLKKSVTTYSKGMKQKIGLLATILSGRPVTILDEPMSGLDPRARQEIKEMILAVKNEGRSVFMSSHILADMTELCDRMAVFHNKKLVFIGTPQAFLDEGQDNNPEKAFLNIIKPKK